MNEREYNFFGTIYDLFGETTSKVMYNIYVGFIHDMKMFGLLFSLPVKYVKFFKESYHKRREERKKREG